LFSICLFKKAPSLWVIKIHFRWSICVGILADSVVTDLWGIATKPPSHYFRCSMCIESDTNGAQFFHAFRTFSGGGGIDLTDLVMALAQTSQICINLRQRSILSGIRKKTCVGCRNF
jgi:hypothetical protein